MKKGLRGGMELETVEARLGEMDQKLDRLRTLYESFFMGAERTPPNTARREMNRLMLEMQQVPIGNATARFRFQSLLQRWVQLTTYWNRTMREIENGSYRRDIARAQRHLASRGSTMTETDALALGIPSSRVKAFVDRQNRSAGPPTTKGGESAPASTPKTASAVGPNAAGAEAPSGHDEIPGLRAGEFDAFYDRFVAAHKEASGAPPKASKEQLRDRLKQDLPRLAGSAGRVELEVRVENGKVRLKARPAK